MWEPWIKQISIRLGVNKHSAEGSFYAEVFPSLFEIGVFQTKGFNTELVDSMTKRRGTF